MRKIIYGKMYNTKTATLIGTCCPISDRGNFNYYNSEMYKKRTGEYFLFNEYWIIGEGFHQTIEPMSQKEAKEWMGTQAEVDEYIAEFGEPEE